MFGNNKIAKINKNEDNIYEIVKIFPTFQGEGIFTGYPAIFVRLSLCNLSCNFCDTEFSIINKMKLGEIIDAILEHKKKFKAKLIIITGGEPLRQNIYNLCKELLLKDFIVQIETNGTLYQKLPINDNLYIMISPKMGKNNFYQTNLNLIKNHIKNIHFKFLISKYQKSYSTESYIKNFAKKYLIDNNKIYIQPIDEYDNKKNQENYKLVTEIAKNNCYKISLQIHKILKFE